MKIIEKDILTVEKGIICQQVNCQGVMGSGLAKAIRDKWPVVYDDYKERCELYKHDFQRLGGRRISQVLKDSLYVVSIFGQLNYGSVYDIRAKVRYTDYGALNECFRDLCYKSTYNVRFDEFMFTDLYFPFNFGCDRGGGDWNIVSKMIDHYFPNAIVCKLPENKG